MLCDYISDSAKIFFSVKYLLNAGLQFVIDKMKQVQ